jgi:hypothetical protein
MFRTSIKKRARDNRLLTDLESKTSREIYNSDYFNVALSQTHHNQTTVAVHTLGVAATSLRLYYILNALGCHLDKESLLKSSLCHDLGIVGRNKKFDNNRECLKKHPVDSVIAARDIFPNLDERTEDAIRHHMWPCTPLPPHHREGFIVTVADKYCAAIEGVAGRFYCPGNRVLKALRQDEAVLQPAVAGSGLKTAV